MKEGRSLAGRKIEMREKMPKNQKRQRSQCTRHDFSLKPKSQFTLHPQYLQVSFCTQTSQRGNSLGSVPPCINYPIFNRDSNFATPTFILASEQNHDEAEGQRMREEHQRRMQSYTDQKSSLNVPKPRSKHNYCSVCRHSYTDYIEHIESSNHKKRINASDFNKHILALADKFKRLHPHPNRHGRRQANIKQEDHSIEIISNPQKKVKLNENVQPTTTNTPRNTFGGLPFSNQYLEQASLINPHRMNENNNFNFNINMNLYLNQMPLTSMPSFLGGNSYTPFLDLQYQNMLYAQMNQMNQIPMIPSFCQYSQQQLQMALPAPSFQAGQQQQQRPVTYIVIDE